MKEIAACVGLAVVALLIIGAAVFAGGDRSLFVPVPEMVVEDFTREVVTRRFDLATKYLSTGRQQTETPESIAGRFTPLFQMVGKVNSVDTEPQWVDAERATATATVEGDAGSVSFGFSLVRENGLWKIDELPKVLTPDS